MILFQLKTRAIAIKPTTTWLKPITTTICAEVITTKAISCLKPTAITV